MYVIAEKTGESTAAAAMNEHMEGILLRAIVLPNPDAVPICDEQMIEPDALGRLRIFFEDLCDITAIIRILEHFKFQFVCIRD